jgi:hypothetical protein
MSGIPGYGKGQFTLGIFTYLKASCFYCRSYTTKCILTFLSTADHQVALQVDKLTYVLYFELVNHAVFKDNAIKDKESYFARFSAPICGFIRNGPKRCG